MNKELNKKVQIALYVIGIILILVSFVQYVNRSDMALHESTGVVKAIYWLIAGCTLLIMGHLTALIDKTYSNHKDEQENS